MAETIIGLVGSMFAGGATAGATAGAATAGATAGAAAGTGLTLSTILQGGATVLGIVSAIGAGNADADALELQAKDQERQQALDTLQGIDRRTSIKKALRDATGAQDVAYASSGVDLSFGTAAKARNDANRESDLALNTSSGTELSQSGRLMERAANYRSSAKRARRGGLIDAAVGGIKNTVSILDRY